jgi:hypothetical protein
MSGRCRTGSANEHADSRTSGRHSNRHGAGEQMQHALQLVHEARQAQAFKHVLASGR